MKKITLIKGDRLLWIAFIVLSVISLIAVFSASGLTANTHASTPMRFFFKHLLFVAVAYILAFLVAHVNYRFFAKATPWLLAAVLAILVVVAFSSTRWISLPIIGRFQPSEIAKILIVAFTAKQLADPAGDINHHHSLVIN